MLFTRCPDCQTNFRITADALRKADGQVKCGHCKTVFNAYEELRNDNPPDRGSPSPGGSTHEPFDPLGETDEYVALGDDGALGDSQADEDIEILESPTMDEDLERPDGLSADGDIGVFESPSTDGDTGVFESPSADGDTGVFESPPVDEDVEIEGPVPVEDADPPESGGPSEPPAAAPEEPGEGAHDRPSEGEARADDETVEPEAPRVEAARADVEPFEDLPLSEAEELELAERLRAESGEHEEEPRPQDGDHRSATEPSLEFNLPRDEWTAFFEHAAKEPLADGLPQGGGVSRVPADDRAEPADAAGEIVVMEVVDAPDEAKDPDAHDDGDAEDDASRIAQLSEPAGAAASSRAAGYSPELGVADAAEDTAEDVAEATAASEEAGAAGDAGAADEPFAQPRALRNRIASHRWSIASVVFLAFLVLQIVHHFRAPLSGQPVVGPLLRSAYSMAGTEISPDWDLSQYVIMDWVATADAETEGPGSLEISARIHNRGPRAQPYPRVRLELKDRWEATVGSRVFTADEYLPEELTNERIMDAGSTVPARLEVVDPGQDAYGFELDICAEINAGGLRCASDNIFQ